MPCRNLFEKSIEEDREIKKERLTDMTEKTVRNMKCNQGCEGFFYK